MARILQITDPHVVVPPRLVSGRLDTARLLQSAVARIKQDWARFAPIDIIVVTGDITDDGGEDSFRLFRSVMADLPVPVLVIPGNHDLREPLRACFGDAAFMPPTGRINWVHDLCDLRIVGLDTMIEGQGGGVVDSGTLEFLSDALAESGEKPVLIAMHHPPFASGIAFMDAIGLAGIPALAGVLSQAKAEVRIICGHVHGTIVGTVGGHVAISSAAVCSAFPADYRRDAPVGFTINPGGYMIHSWDGCFRSAAVSLGDADGPHPFQTPETA
ncbi:MAG: phosphodiesterase [Rhodobacter sp.]|nr:phosphodiesterase [Rhodobacter sp.]